MNWMRKCRLKSCRAELPSVKESNHWQKQNFCNVDHMAAHGLAKARRQQERARLAKVKQERAEHRDAKLRLKTRSQWMREAQQAFNRYVRARDLGLPCASCGAQPRQKRGGTMDCSHYRSVGSAAHLRFNLHNAAAACVRCNRELSGNVVELRKGLIERIGVAKVEAVELNNEIRRFDVNYLKRVKNIFKKKATIAEKRYNAGQQILQVSVTPNHQLIGVSP